MTTAIKNETEYKAALTEVERLIELNVALDSREGDRLNLLTLLLQDYEKKTFELQNPDPIDAIKFRMEQMGLAPRDLIPFIGSRSKVSEVLAKKRPLTLAMVRALHRGLGIPAAVLIQEQQNLFGEDDEVEWQKFPLREMIARKWVPRVLNDGSSDAASLMKHFIAPLGARWIPAALYKQTRYVRSPRIMDQHALAAWNARVCIKALENAPAVGFDRKRITMSFLHEVAHLSALVDGPKHVPDYLRNVGVSIVIEPSLPETYIDGAAILLSPTHPVIGLTIRHDRVDNFWFALMHELVHVWKHLDDKTNVFYDDLDVDDSENEREREADHLAGEALIPGKEWEESPARNLRTPEAVLHLSSRLRIHPAIVAGRIRHYYKSYRVLSRLVGQGEVRKLFPDVFTTGN